MLEIRQLSVRYGRAVQALRGVSLAVPAGGVVAVLGSNGAGKTTLLRAVSGTLPLHRGSIDAGDVTFDGARLARRDPADIVAAGVVGVPEGRRVFGRLTVDENLRAGAIGARDRRSRTAARERVYATFPRLAERRDQRARLLSGGEQQMLAIARGLMAGPRLLLLDEPSLGLAPRVVTQVADVVRQISAQGTSVLLVEQNAAMALAVSDHAYVLALGRVALERPSAELAGSAEMRRVYLGEAAWNEHEATPTEREASGTERRPA
ncbi:ABC transporter ATP-binding protein [Planosporangium flavigriseum]|uniref:ABC transporter ATP-binding protein n=1 Tax=Planosporangium flavigriseum TaxID=373681 RepID=A0A8J3M3Q1_9ACTN|nr:ABC transporter ATP-binding protein [Planosporangium flavigriseum]NJC67861.1 ABC transporter ATP-binding protein [Planosporangium flavigriseum]GIG76320.1 ABC transporter ATP-binding protein [Planosporangium flavigriseum]